MMRDAMVFKIVIIGDGAVGKTTLTKVFCNNPYVDQIMTIGIDIHAKEVVVNGKQTILQIWDISGQEQFKFMIPDFVNGARAVILAFDRTRLTTFDHLDDWLKEIHTHASKAPIILISTKGDQQYHPSINPEMALEYVKKNSLIAFVETSAKLSQNVNLPFQRLLEHLYNLEPDTSAITFLGPGEEFKPLLATESSKTSPIDTPAPSAENKASQQPQASSEQATPLVMENPRVVNPSITCNFCSNPLRKSQIKLKQSGKKVLCQNCFNLT